MLFRAFTLLALACSANAEIDLNVNPVAEDAEAFDAEAFRSAFEEHVRPALQTMQPFSYHAAARVAEDPKPKDACKACVGMVTEAVIKVAVKNLELMCYKNAEEKRVFRLCMMMSAHPKVTLGALIEHIRPVGLAFMYCKGHGDCTKPSLDQADLEELASEHAEGEHLSMLLDDIDLHHALEDAEELEPALALEDEEEWQQQPKAKEDEGEAEDRHGHRHFEHCMRRASRKVMGFVIWKVKERCEHTHCPKFKKQCAWAAKNKEIVFGVLLMKVEPWKFAMGWCMHRHWNGHHHHHHHQGYKVAVDTVTV